MPRRTCRRSYRLTCFFAAVVIAALFVAGCGSDAAKSAGTTPTKAHPSTASSGGSSGGSTTEGKGASTTTSTTSTTTSAPATTTTTEPPLPVEEGDLKQGSQGERTRKVQQALDALHIDVGDADGQFGGNTLMGLWTFEALDGHALTTTISADLEQRILHAKPLTMLRPELGPTHVEVDLDRQVLLVWIDGKLRVATHTSTAGGYHYCGTYKTGQHYCAYAVTPTGTYHFGRRVSGWEVAPLGKLYNPVYFNGGIAVHGEPWVGATPASHGCVRIPMLVAEYFPSLVHTGDTIVVFNGGHTSVVAV